MATAQVSHRRGLKTFEETTAVQHSTAEICLDGLRTRNISEPRHQYDLQLNNFLFPEIKQSCYLMAEILPFSPNASNNLNS